jgi:hypothetical protein
MKVWASASAIGLSMAYFATACSSTPPDDNTYNPTAGTSTGGTPGASGTAPTSGSGNPTGGTPGTGGTPAGTSGTPATGGTPGGGGDAPTAGTTGMAGSGGTGPAGAETEVACPANVLGHCSMGSTYMPYDGYTLALVEDFPVAIDLDKDPIFTWSDGSPADGQTGFRKEQLTFKDGKMLITAEAPAGCAAKTTNAGCVPGRTSFGEAQAPATKANVGAMGVWSGELRSKYNNYRYGRYEAKYTAPVANPGQEATDNMSGNYLSTMFIFRTPKNVQWNEIDVELEPWKHNMVAGNVVNATYPGNMPVSYPSGNAADFAVAGPTGQYAITQEHVYAFNWTPTLIEWFVDGVSVHKYMGEKPSDPIPTMSAKIMMNLWVFSGTTFGDGVNNKFPFHATYDYFRFYKLNTEAKYPCATPPACLDAADKTASSQNNPMEMNYGM